MKVRKRYQDPKPASVEAPVELAWNAYTCRERIYRDALPEERAQPHANAGIPRGSDRATTWFDVALFTDDGTWRRSTHPDAPRWPTRDAAIAAPWPQLDTVTSGQDT